MRSKQKTIIIHVAILLGLSLYLFFWRIGDLNLFGTEAHRALPARAMIETHDWLIPRLSGEPFLTKPPLTYWLIGLFSLPQAQVTETSARLPSAVLATVLILIIYWFVATTVNLEAGFLSALVALTTYIIFEKATAAEIDMHLAAAIGISLLFAYKGINKEKHKLPYMIAASLFFTAAFLSKGPPAIIFFGATVAGYLLWEKRLKFLWSLPNVVSFCIFLSICLLWVSAVVTAIGFDRLYGNLQREFLARVGSSTSFRPADIFFYPVGIAAGFAPWSFFLPFAFLPSYYRSLDQERRSLHRFLLCGVILNVILFSTVSGKANRYLLPVYPPLAILVGLWWKDLIDHKLSERLQARLQRLMKILFATSAAGLIIFLLAKIILQKPDFPVSVPLFAGLSVVLLIGSVFVARSQYRRAFASMIVFFLLVKLTYVFDYVPYRNSRHSIQHIAAGINQVTEPGKTIYTPSFNKPHIFFYLHDPVIKLNAASSLYHAAKPSDYFLMTEEERRAFVEQGMTAIPLYQFAYRKQQISVVHLEPNNSSPPSLPFISQGAAKKEEQVLDDEQ